MATEATDARLLVLHWHTLDAMDHTFVQAIDPTGGGYGPARAGEERSLGSVALRSE